MEMEASEFWIACSMEAIWPRICSEMTRLAGPSAARLIFCPEDSTSRLLERSASVAFRLRRAFSAATL